MSIQISWTEHFDGLIVSDEGGTMTGSIKPNSQAICGVLSVIIILAMVYMYYPSKEQDIISSLQKVDERLAEETGDRNNADLVNKDESSSWSDLIEKLSGDPKLSLKETVITVNNQDVYYREGVSAAITNPKGTLLFLHGAAFQSKNWKDLGTLHFMADAGYRPIAIDIPGYGLSKPFDIDPVAFMLGVKEALELKETPIIIISPSMSGGYSIPLLFSNPEAFKGFVPVAPVGTDKHTDEEYKKVQVPTCIIYGEKDTSLGVSSLKNLVNIPSSEVHMLKGAGHPAYMNEPEEFHQILLKFSNKVFTES